MNNTETNAPYMTKRDLVEILEGYPDDAKIAIGIYTEGSTVPKDGFATAVKRENRTIGNVLTILGE